MVLPVCDAKVEKCKVESRSRVESWENTTVESCWRRVERAITIRSRKFSITTNLRSQPFTGNWISCGPPQMSRSAMENRCKSLGPSTKIEQKYFLLTMLAQIFFLIAPVGTLNLHANQWNSSFQSSTGRRSQPPRQLRLQCPASCSA